MRPSDETRNFWAQASGFPPDKEDPEVYGKEHTDAFEFDDRTHGHVLEYGCGGGSDTISYLKRRFFQVSFCDIVPQNVETTRKRVAAYRQAHVVDDTWGLPASGVWGTVLPVSAPLPYDSASFDRVSCDGVLHHIPDPMPVLSEFRRVLKPTGASVSWSASGPGRLFVMLYTEKLWNDFAVRIAELQEQGLTPYQAFGMCTDSGGYARAYTEDEGREMLTAAGFTVTKTTVYHKGLFRVFRAYRTR